MQRMIIPGARVLQRKRATLTTEFSYGGSLGSYIDFGLSAQITPLAANSFIRISGQIDGLYYASALSGSFIFRILRNAVQVKEFGGYTAYIPNVTDSSTAPVSIFAQDSPAAPGQLLTYKVQLRPSSSGGGVFSVNLGAGSSVSLISELVLEEVLS